MHGDGPMTSLNAGRWAAAIAGGIVILATLAVSTERAYAQSARTVRIVVPYTPGSGPDILSRLMAEQVGRMHAATMVVEDRPGGGTLVGTEAAARAAPDGGTVLLVANSFVVNPVLKKQNYDPLTSFEPICQLAATPIVLVVAGSSPYRTLADLVAAARDKPGELSLASGGPGSSLRIPLEGVQRAAHISLTYLPHGGPPPPLTSPICG